MRRVFCSTCGKQHHSESHSAKELFPANAIEPAEYGRVVWGTVQTPQEKDRFVLVNGVRHQLPLGHFDCDLCGDPIVPGTQACCCRRRSSWRSGGTCCTSA